MDQELIKKMMINGPNHNEFTENMQRCHDYIKALEKERQKIQAFRRELPLCLELVTQAIDTCKQQLSGTTKTTTQCNLRGQSECSEQTSSEVPVYEEFIPIKRASSDSDGEDEEFKESNNDVSEKNCKKSDWLRSVQLWNQIPDPPSKDVILDSSRKFSNRNSGGDAFDYFKKERGVAGDGPAREAAAAPASTSSKAENGGGCKKEGRSPRKARRCWSPELHRRFLQVLQQLGGPYVATPKQVRELMKVDGLTNDEVKSHLQKYRLHARRPSPSTHNNNAQFVVVGGLWMPSPYASKAAIGDSATKGIYAPVSAPALPPSCSPATPSTHSITAVSPAC